MNRIPRCTSFLCTFLFLFSWALAKDGRFLTPESDADPMDILIDYVLANSSKYHLTAEDIAEFQVTHQRQDKKTGITYLYLGQMHDGIAVKGAILNGAITPRGELIHLGNRFVKNLAQRVEETIPAIPQQQAYGRTAELLGVVLKAPAKALSEADGPEKKMMFEGLNLSHDPVPVQLVYVLAEDGAVKLGWQLVVRQMGTDDWWEMVVSARDGSLLKKHNYTVYDRWAPGSGFINKDRIEVGRAGFDAKRGGGGSYFVLPGPVESPNHGAFALVNDPAHLTASPFGWHDTDGVPGAEFTTTQGNNVHAYQDRDGNDSPAGDDPDGGAGLVFNIPPDFGQEPINYTDSATINLFYWNNLIHDVLYFYGFDEEGGNFQENNYGNGGAGSDSVNAQSQSRADQPPSDTTRNNANFSTPSDGANPRMRMYEWTEPLNTSFTVNAPASIAGDYGATAAGFGGDLLDNPLTGDVELVDDGDNEGGAGSVTDACQDLVGFTAGRIAILDRGACEFGVKVLNAEEAGAIGAIVVNNQGNGTISMGGGAVGDQVTIPAVMIGQDDGQLIKDALAGKQTVNITTVVEPSTLPNRDSDFDNGIIAHEYGHGVSNRLTGGPNQVGCLGGDEQAGEGWSDFIGLYFTAQPGDQGTDVRGIGTYPSFEPVTGGGIRPFPYSTDMGVNGVTYDNVGDFSIPHGVGFVFCTMLWDMYWALVDEHGYDADLYEGTGGNNIAFRLVMEGMALQPCTPGFVDARDAIIAADEALNGGENVCLIWQAFANRGLGLSADQGAVGSVTDGTPAFDVPMAVITGQPQSVSDCTGETVVLTVIATGPSLSYQWRKDGLDLPGENGATLTLTNIQMADAGDYDVVVSSSGCPVTSDTATVTVGDGLSYGNEAVSLWTMPVPGCDDVNSNGFLDVQDLSQLVNEIE